MTSGMFPRVVLTLALAGVLAAIVMLPFRPLPRLRHAESVSASSPSTLGVGPFLKDSSPVAHLADGFVSRKHPWSSLAPRWGTILAIALLVVPFWVSTFRFLRPSRFQHVGSAWRIAVPHVATVVYRYIVARQSFRKKLQKSFMSKTRSKRAGASLRIGLAKYTINS
jgi:hypothetical protein